MLRTPRIAPTLGERFLPAALVHGGPTGGSPRLALALERPGRSISRHEVPLPEAGDPLFLAERVFKFLLWQRGGYWAYTAPEELGIKLQELYSPGGARGFDARMMETIYGRPFQVRPCSLAELPLEREVHKPLGGHWEGYRVGFDLGASDIKVAAVAADLITLARPLAHRRRGGEQPAG